MYPDRTRRGGDHVLVNINKPIWIALIIIAGVCYARNATSERAFSSCAAIGRLFAPDRMTIPVGTSPFGITHLMRLKLHPALPRISSSSLPRAAASSLFTGSWISAVAGVDLQQRDQYVLSFVVKQRICCDRALADCATWHFHPQPETRQRSLIPKMRRSSR